MKTPSLFQRRASQMRKISSSAIIVVLFFVVLLSILVIGFLTSMRLETVSSKSHRDDVTAELYADSGIRVAVSQLYTALSNPTNFYASSPGRLVVYNPASLSTPKIYTNCSGIENSAVGSVPVNEAVDLNPAALEYPGYSIAQTNAALPTPQMYVRWIYQHQDGTFDANSPPAASPPVIGRFAYWIDDEASKINLNTARGRDSLNATNSSSPSRISLGVLSTNTITSLDPTNMFTYASTNHYNSVDEAGRAPNIPTDVLQQKFSATTYSHSPNISMTGAPRILLTTQKWLADANGTTNFIDILSTESTASVGHAGYVDPGTIDNLDATKTSFILGKITDALNNTANWPFAPGKTFAQKYTGKVDTNATALNILEYVRDVESTNVVVEPIFISTLVGSTNFGAFATGATHNVVPTAAPGKSSTHPAVNIMSTGRRIYIDEIGVYLSQATTATAPTGTATITGVPAGTQYIKAPFYVKLYLPYFPGNQYADLTQYYLDEEGGKDSDGGAAAMPVYAPATLTSLTSYSPSGLTRPLCVYVISPTVGQQTLYPGHTVTVTEPTYFYMAKTGTTFPTWTPSAMSIEFFFALIHNLGKPLRMEYAHDQNYQTAAPATVTNSIAVDDPLVNKYYVTYSASPVTEDFIPTTANGFTQDGLTRPSTSVVGSPSLTSPEQDYDASGNVTTNYAWMPAPNGDPNNPSGMVQSVAELGYVHVGADSEGAVVQGVPWRTVHLQPQKNRTLLPDWAMLDLFSAPINTNAIPVSSQPYILPYNTNITQPSVPSRGGLINVNAVTQGFGPVNNPSIATNRILPLTALLNGAGTNTPAVTAISRTIPPPANPGFVIPTVTQTQANALATNILNYVTASGVGGGMGTNYDAGKAMTNYYFAGQLAEVSGIADTGEASEATIREITSGGSVNGNVFSIYCVGQSLRQDSGNGIHVTGEQRKQAIVERIVIPGSPPTVQFQTVFSQDL